MVHHLEVAPVSVSGASYETPNVSCQKIPLFSDHACMHVDSHISKPSRQ